MVGCSCLISRRLLHTTLHLRGVQDTPLLCALWEEREGFVAVSFFVSRALILIGLSVIPLGVFVSSGLKG